MINSKFKILINAFFAFFFGAMVTSVALSSYKSYKKKTFRPNFIYKGFESLSVQDLEKEYGAESVEEILETISQHPTSCTKDSPKSADLSAKSAAKIGIAILASKYGRNFINSQKPFHVFLLENKVWKIKGNKNNLSHACSEIYIQKADAQILRIVHNIK